MTNPTEDWKVTLYALGDLEGEEREAHDREVAIDSDLAARVDLIRRQAGDVALALAGEPMPAAALRPSHAPLHAGPLGAAPRPVADWRPARAPVHRILIGAAVAALAICASLTPWGGPERRQLATAPRTAAPNRALGMQYLKEGTAVFEAGDFVRAKPLLELAVKADPANAAAKSLLDDARLMTGEYGGLAVNARTDIAASEARVRAQVDEVKSRYQRGLEALENGDGQKAAEDFAFVEESTKWFPYKVDLAALAKQASALRWRATTLQGLTSTDGACDSTVVRWYNKYREPSYPWSPAISLDAGDDDVESLYAGGSGMVRSFTFRTIRDGGVAEDLSLTLGTLSTQGPAEREARHWKEESGSLNGELSMLRSSYETISGQISAKDSVIAQLTTQLDEANLRINIQQGYIQVDDFVFEPRKPTGREWTADTMPHGLADCIDGAAGSATLGGVLAGVSPGQNRARYTLDRSDEVGDGWGTDANEDLIGGRDIALTDLHGFAEAPGHLDTSGAALHRRQYLRLEVEQLYEPYRTAGTVAGTGYQYSDPLPGGYCEGGETGAVTTTDVKGHAAQITITGGIDIDSVYRDDALVAVLNREGAARSVQGVAQAGDSSDSDSFWSPLVTLRCDAVMSRHVSGVIELQSPRLEYGESIQPNGGTTVLHGQAVDAVFGSLVNNSGAIEARGLSVTGAGTVTLTASTAITHAAGDLSLGFEATTVDRAASTTFGGIGPASAPGTLTLADIPHVGAAILAPQGGKQPPPAAQEPEGPEEYEHVPENPILRVADQPLSTFSIDVDSASYTNVRRFLHLGQLPPPDAVRVEELVNYFPYDYNPPDDGKPFAVHLESAACPWNKDHRLLRVGLKGRTLEKRPPSNLVFLIDVSGSMDAPNKLPLVQAALRILARQLTRDDRVAIVVYAGESGLVLPSTPGNQNATILDAIEGLKAGGSTNGAAGIELAYKIASENFIKDGTNRVILATDGDWNVGAITHADLMQLIIDKAASGVFLTVLGFGMGNYKDGTLEMLADKGNGNYAYVDSIGEARKVLVEQMAGTLCTIAKDVKIQIEFNPARVAGYRLIGYENRMLAKEDFNDDKKDAGEIGAGHTVTALYELIPAGREVEGPSVDPLKYQAAPAPAAPNAETCTVKLRYKEPQGTESALLSVPFEDKGGAFDDASEDFRFAAAVAGYGMKLRHSRYAKGYTWDALVEVASGALGADHDGYRAELVELVKRAKSLSGK